LFTTTWLLIFLSH